MKKLLLFFLCFSFGWMLQAQVSKTVNVTAGNLSAMITNGDLSTVRSLTITGTIDARDFRFMRDKLEFVTHLDLSQVSIVAYKGTDGTMTSNEFEYAANRIPDYAFRPWELAIQLNLSSVVFPTSLNSIGMCAFEGCTYLKSVTIPSSIRKIEGAAFRSCVSLTALIIPSSVDTIGPDAFAECKALSSLNLPSTIKSIGAGAFRNCVGLTSVTIPPSITSMGDAFAGCTGLTQIVLPESITSLDYGAFMYCTGLKSINIPQGVTSIGANAFVNCTSLTSVTIPSQVTIIGESIFSNCTNLTTVTILSPTMWTNNWMFANCSKITSLKVSWTVPPTLLDRIFYMINRTNCALQVPFGTALVYKSDMGWNQFKSITESSSGLYVGTTDIKLSSISGSNANIDIVTNLEWTASSDQPWLTVTPASGATTTKLTLTAQENLFVGSRTAKVTISSPGLTSQIISVTQNSAEAMLSDVTPGSLINKFTAAQLNTITSLRLKGSIDARDFKTMRDSMPLLAELDLSEVTIAAYDGLYGPYEDYMIQYPANTIPEYAFYSRTGSSKTTLNSVIFPSTLTGFGQFSFEGCSNLKSLNIPVLVNSIGIGSFGGCSSLKSLTIPPNVTKIEESAFMGCSGLISVEFPPTLTSIGMSAFHGCSSLTTIDIPSSLTVIKTSTFSDCIGLTSLNIPPTITSIEDYAFNECTGLISVNLPNSITSIGSAFIQCSGLTSITIPESVTALGNEAFKGCTALKSVTIPASVTTIGGYAFSYCDNLTSVTINSKNISIWDGAFSNCNNMTTVAINALSATMENYIFNSCAKLASITLACAIPPKCGYYNFYMVDRDLCSLNVPYGTISRYAAAPTWKEFIKVIQMPGFCLSSNAAKVESIEGSTATVNISTNVDWTSTSDQEWLTLSPTSGSGLDQKLTFTAKANTETRQRKATITISSPGIVSQEITLTQMPAATKIDITAGSLASVLMAEELNTITDLTITGTIDARDFDTMRDRMPLLTKLDISGATIAAYMYSPANEIPQGAFYKHTVTTNLTSVIFPQSLTAIGRYAFYNCAGLTDIVIPSMVTTIKGAAFYNCSGLKSVFIPFSVMTMEDNCFAFCPKLTSITIESSIPPNLNSVSDVFYQVDKSLCVLNVPYNSAGAYRNAYQWGYFQNILEATDGFNVSSVKVRINGTVGSTATVDINSNLQWTASSDQDWLVVNPTSGNGVSQTITFTAEANPSFINTRTAYVTIAAPGVTSQIIAVTQNVHPQSPKTWEATPGGLAAAFTAEELATIYDLTLTGAIDARDFKTMRDQMPLLAKLDLNGVTIIAYTGTEGTAGIENAAYAENTVPDYAFIKKGNYYKTNNTLSSLILPASLTAIGQHSFNMCTALQDVTIPSSVTSIDAYAFNGCNSMENITIPSLVENIGVRAFGELSAVINVDPDNSNYMSSEGVLFNKDQTKLIQCMISKSGSYTIPSTVTTVGEFAFFDCRQLTSITIPSSVVAIGTYAFASCFGLNSLIVHSTIPINFDSSDYIFSEYNNCTLYIPVGSKTAYQSANLWENFSNIIEVNPDLIAEAGPNQQIDERTLVTLSGSVKLNTSGKPVTYQWTAPEEITLSSDTAANPTFTAPDVSYESIFTFSLTISDGLNNSTAAKVYIVVRHVNRSPVANAGSDQIVNERSQVTLDGSASFDPDDNYLSYEWTGPNAIYINSRHSSKATFTAPEVNADTNFIFYLRVNETFAYHTDTVVITVKSINQVPVANAGNMQMVNEGESVTLDATRSTDADGDPLTYKWTAPEGITLSSLTSATPGFTVPTVESDTWFNFKLVVNDGKVNSSAAQVDVLVRNIPSVLKLWARVNNLDTDIPVNFKLYKYDGNSFIHKIDTFAVTGDSIDLMIEPGYWIGLVAPTLDPSSFIPTYSGDALNWDEAEIIHVPVNGVASMGITGIAPQDANTGVGQIAGFVFEKPDDVTKSISISREENLVIDHPVQNALIQLYKKGSTIPVASVFTDYQGAYQFDKLAVADYEIVVEIPGFIQSDKFSVALSEAAPMAKANFGVDTSLQTITDNRSWKASILKVYPNPTRGVVYIYGLPESGENTVSVCTMDGRTVVAPKPLTEGKIDLSNQVPGIYLLMVNKERIKIIKK